MSTPAQEILNEMTAAAKAQSRADETPAPSQDGASDGHDESHPNAEMWSDLLDEDDGDEQAPTPEGESAEAEESPETPPPEVEAQSPEGQPAEAPVEETPPAPEEQAAPAEEPPQAAPEATPEQPPAEAQPPEQTAEQKQQMRDDAEKQLQTYFKLSDEDSAAMRDDPGSVLPKLAAKLYLDVYDSVMNGISAALPRMVVGIQRQETARTQAESAFYDKWKALDTAEGRALVQRLGSFYTQANPQATLDSFVNDVGLQAMIQLRLPIEGVTAPATQTPPQAPPPAPAGRGTVPAAPTSAPTNPFAALAQEFLEEDEVI